MHFDLIFCKLKIYKIYLAFSFAIVVGVLNLYLLYYLMPFMNHFKRYLFVVFFVSASLLMFAQSDSDLKELQEAYVNIQDGQYSKALPYYSKMLNYYPKDPTYNYYIGRCFLFTGKDIEIAIKHLRFASTRNVSADVYFYLGLAYLKNYEFEEAEANFKWFEKQATKKQARELDVLNYKSNAQNGLFLIKYFKKLLISNKTNVSQQDFYKSYDLDKLEGDLVNRFEYFNHKRDSTSLPNILFVPSNLENKDVLYFSAKNKKRGDYDIFRITRLSDTSWSNAENLGGKINTPFDENFPFIHSDGSSLFFASKGHYSMGGYDLYKSTWSWEKNEWTEPENLDFPINSPFDDILFIPSQDMETACFASNRESQESMFAVCKIKLESNAPYLEYVSNEQIRNSAHLKVNYVAENDKVKKQIKKDKKVSNSVVKTVDEETFVGRFKYDSLLNRAINLQLKADSIKWLIDDKRINFENAREGQERIKIGNQIVEFEKEIYSLQKQADICYERVREIEQINLASKSISYDKTVVDETKSIRESKEEIKNPKTNFVESKDDNLQRSILKQDEKISNVSADNYQFGLRVKQPSIYNLKNPIKINETLPQGIVYLIQLGAFSSEKDPSVFKGMEPITCVKKDNSKIHKYYAGRFLNLSNAEKNLALVKSKGFKDAYIVAFNNGKVIPINSALKLESKQNNREIIDELEPETVKKESVDLSIIYVLKGTIKANNTELMSELKSNLKDNLEMYIDDAKTDGNLIIKPFKTFDEANLIKNKFENIIGSEFEIHAYFAENQIPLDQARKITQ